MIKKTIYLSKAFHLSVKDRQMVITPREGKAKRSHYEEPSLTGSITKPIEDIGVVVIDSPQITITSALLEILLEHNVAVISCDKSHLPTGLMLPLNGNTLQSERFTSQIKATLPLKKQLWQQTVRAKIMNQASVIKRHAHVEHRCLVVWANNVKSGDTENLEGRAAAYYWKNIFGISSFRREREGDAPNNLLNYGYAILRGVIARSLVSSGLLPTLGIHHHNRYNAYCLADDIMEPYRPYVDELVIDILEKNPDVTELTKEIKAELLNIPSLDVRINRQKRPLMVAATITTSSLAQCFSGELRQILYPTMEV